MPEKQDRQAALREQYKDSSNFMARVRLHQRFGQNRGSFPRWVFDHIHIQPHSAVLELGCGPGIFWVNNLDRIPGGWQITLSDFSPGMLKEAEENLRAASRPFSYQLIDAQAIPFADQSLDAVIANHMLYHVPDKAKAFGELRRVLKSEGRLFAATNGNKHMGELRALTSPYEAPATPSRALTEARSFTLEGGALALAQWFAHVDVYPLEDQLMVTEVEPLMAYIGSGYLKDVLAQENMEAVRKTVEQRIATEGAIRIARVSGLIEAYGVKEA
jgi:ubiquinone/menaquinone biosynthesis C-methylase UbiE